jgi:transcriptional regulator with XRE-family HTH domain
VNNEQHIEFGEIIRERRRSLKITQSLLADIAGVARHTITDIESGKGNPTIAVVRRLLSPLGLKLVIEIAEPAFKRNEVRS